MEKIGNIIYYNPSFQNRYLNSAIELLIEEIFQNLKTEKPSVDISIERDNNYILNLLVTSSKENSIITNEVLLKEWNYEKNGKLNPEYIKITSVKKVWWKCNKGHEWEAIVNVRNRGNGCPYCANQKVIADINDLATLKPILIKYWNYEKNDKLKPKDVGISSGKKVWWRCPICKHEWISRIADVTRKKHICSKCKKDINRN